MNRSRRARLDRIAAQLAGLTRVDAAKRVAEELRAIEVHASVLGEREGLLHIDQDRTPGKRRIRLLAEEGPREGGVLIIQYEDDPPEFIAARDAKLRELRARGFNPPVVIINSLESRFDRWVPGSPPQRATSNALPSPFPES